MMDFADEFVEFLDGEGVKFERSGNTFVFPGKGAVIHLVYLAEGMAEPFVHNDVDWMLLYEDRWRFEKGVIRKRILAHLGRFTSIFARKCEVRHVDADFAAEFLRRYHSYGSSKCRFRYALYYNGECAAVATFSAPRPMPREIGGQVRLLDSYEWVRYASLPDCRIAGGMGKLLQAFVDEVHPDEVMSYADCEWSRGGVYEKLGFVRVGEKPPILFKVNPVTFERISAKKLAIDRSVRGLAGEMADSPMILNRGSVKYLKIYVK